VKAILEFSPSSGTRDYYAVSKTTTVDEAVNPAEEIEALRQEMFVAAENLEFEKAARIRDRLRTLTAGTSGEPPAGPTKASAGGARKRGQRGGPRAGRS
jgi:excinuclease ABC subunit B